MPINVIKFRRKTNLRRLSDLIYKNKSIAHIFITLNFTKNKVTHNFKYINRQCPF